MAGGKETPRQKMIGMMYLVLTALLALNVSKAILDAFVAIEENIQISNINEYGRGREKRLDLEEVAKDKSVPDTQKKAKKLLLLVDQIDKKTAEEIKFIDDLKLEILKECGENVNSTGKESIITIPYSTKEPLKPTRMDLNRVDGKDKYDEPMRVMGIEEDIKKPKGKGIELWERYNKYRGFLTELLASSSSTAEKKYFFKDPKINTFKDFDELNLKLDKAIKTAAPDDQEAIKKIYFGLSKNERHEMHEGELKDVHWIGKTFDHSPSVAALASLSSVQKEILTARADAVALIRSRVGGGEYSFNKIMPLAYGPAIANNGDEAELLVMMAAFDSDNQPEVTGPGAITVADGQARIKVKVSGGAEMPLSGTIAIKNKSGIPKKMDWNFNIKIMKPQGTVSLPDMNVLYRGYDNRIEGVASGYDQTILNGNGVALTKTGTGWIGKPGAGKEATISISGKNSVTNKTVNLGSYKFRVRNLPKPSLYFGGAEDGGQASKAETRLFAKYGPEIPLNVTFTVLSWELNISGAPRPARGTGNSIAGEGQTFLKQAKPGSMVSFMTQVKGPDGVVRKVGGSFRI